MMMKKLQTYYSVLFRINSRDSYANVIICPDGEDINQWIAVHSIVIIVECYSSGVFLQ